MQNICKLFHLQVSDILPYASVMVNSLVMKFHMESYQPVAVCMQMLFSCLVIYTGTYFIFVTSVVKVLCCASAVKV